MGKESKDKVETPAQLNLYQKLAKITGEVGIIAKDGRNQEQKFDFISYAAVSGRLRELFGKYGVVIVPRMAVTAEQRREEIVSKYDKKGVAVLIDFEFQVINADDPADSFTVNWTGEAADFGDKATNKAATSALKYYLMRQFNISEKGEDPDAESPDRGEARQPVRPMQQKQQSAKREPNAQELIAYAGTLLERHGITERDDKVSIILGIANLAGMEMLTPNRLKAVIKVLREEDIDNLKKLYLITEDDLAEEEPNATVIRPEPLTADSIQLDDQEKPEQLPDDVDLVDLAARKAQQPDPHWVIPQFKQSATGMATPEQHKLIKLWLEQYGKTHPDLVGTYVVSVLGSEKHMPGTYDEAMQVIEHLADDLNKIAAAGRAA